MYLRQLLYISSSSDPTIGENLSTILLQSRRNNRVSELTGLLWTDSTRFLQVLEGGHDALQQTFERIQADPRHRALVVLHDRAITERTFGHWSMALIGDSDERIAAALENAEPVVRGTFEGLIQARKAA